MAYVVLPWETNISIGARNRHNIPMERMAVQQSNVKWNFLWVRELFITARSITEVSLLVAMPCATPQSKLTSIRVRGHLSALVRGIAAINP